MHNVVVGGECGGLQFCVQPTKLENGPAEQQRRFRGTRKTSGIIVVAFFFPWRSRGRPLPPCRSFNFPSSAFERFPEGGKIAKARARGGASGLFSLQKYLMID
ncbi:hypothetical protein NL676_016841 [Syzygium grande]|nr:hypothetical protein NL676_016841 [Syzygium grande]